MKESRIIKEALSANPQAQRSLQIVRDNALGNVWLIGGFVYRTLAQRLYERPEPDMSLSFIVENSRQPPILTDGWKLDINHFGNPKFTREELGVALVPLTNIYSILRINIPATIEGYLSGVPFTVQSIAYDLTTEELIGEVGLNAIRTRTVAVLNRESLKYRAHTKRKSPIQLLKELAQSLEFTPVF